MLYNHRLWCFLPKLGNSAPVGILHDIFGPIKYVGYFSKGKHRNIVAEAGENCEAFCGLLVVVNSSLALRGKNKV
jgi:hypothetical protein